MAIQLATAYVPIVPTVAGIQGELARQVVNPAGAAGANAGKKMGGGIRSHVLSSMKGLLATGAALMGGAAIAQQIGKAITGAGDLEQSVGAIDSVFKENAKTMHTWSQTAARDVGLSRNEFNELGTLIGAQLKNGGVAMDELAPKTNDLIGLGSDMASMFGGTTREAVEALSSALKGESDPIERYGVSVTAAAVESEYLAMGLTKVDGEMTKEGKTAATLSLIMKQTQDAHGNFARESDTYAHKVQVFGASWDDLRTKAGTLLLPVLTAVVGFMGDRMLPALETGGRFLGQFFGVLGPILANVGATIAGVVMPPLTTFGNWFMEHRAVIGGILAPIAAFAAGWLAVAGVIKGAGMVMVGFRTAILAVRGGIMAVQGAMVTARIAVMLFNGALLANPIGLVVGAIVALVAGVVLAYHRIGWFKDGVNAVWAGIKNATAAVLSWWTGTLVPNWNAGLAGIGRMFTWLNVNIVQPVWTAMKTGAAIALAVLTTVGQGIAWVLDNTIGRSFRFMRDNVVIPVFNAVRNAAEQTRAWIAAKFLAIQTQAIMLGQKFRELYNNYVRPVFDWIRSKIDAVRAWFVGVAVPAIVNGATRIGAGYRRLWDAYVRPVFDWIRNKINAVRSWFTGFVVDNIVSGANRIGSGFRALFDRYVRPVWDSISSKIRGVWSVIDNRVFNPMVRAITTTVPTAFRNGVDSIGKWWDGLKKKASEPVSFVIDKVINNGFIKHFNNIGSKFGIKRIDPINFNGFRKGGRTGGTDPDEVRGLVHGKEFVFTAERTRELDRTAPGLLDDIHHRGAAALHKHAPGAAPGAFLPSYGTGSWTGGLRSAIFGSGVLNVAGSAPGYDLSGAVGMVDRATRVKVRKGSGGANTVHVRSGNMGAWWAGYQEGNTIRLNDGVAGRMALPAKRVMLAHEIGHALGLPHNARMHGGNGAWSMMNYDNMYQHNSVTSADVKALSAIYGGSGFASGGGAGGDDGNWLLDKISGLISKALGLDSLIKKIPTAGLITDLVTGAVKKMWEGIKTWIGKLDPFKLKDNEDEDGAKGGAIRSQLFDGGGMLMRQAGPQLIEHRSHRPDYVLPEQLFMDMHRAARAAAELERDGGGMNIGKIQGYTADEVAEALERARKKRKALTRR